MAIYDIHIQFRSGIHWNELEKDQLVWDLIHNIETAMNDSIFQSLQLSFLRLKKNDKSYAISFEQYKRDKGWQDMEKLQEYNSKIEALNNQLKSVTNEREAFKKENNLK
ncbi:hypothetical protein C4577_06445 [Candidatus Parcubacteria bacterium]|nr:MAG: hypothetical protein C4577_06445 [Candidatus Parcubacteria bacterium]